MYWKCIGNVLEMYWKCIGNVGTWKNGKSFLSFISYICLFHENAWFLHGVLPDIAE